MPSEQPPVVTPTESVIEFGAVPDEPARGRRRRWNLSGLVASLAGDRRMVPLSAALGAVALFASLVSEWQITSIDTTVFNGAQSGLRPIPTDLIDLGGWAAAYVTGLFVLVSTTVLVLFGPPAGRRYARLTGLSTGGVLVALLAALEPSLDDVSRTLGYVIRFQVSPGQYQVAGGRGIWCAIVGVLAVMLALFLAGRHTPAVAPAVEATPGEAETEGRPDPNWSWRRPRTAGEEDEQPPAAPIDLTVSPTTPFTSLNGDRDKPNEGDGISG
jgi:hypothetical protein